MRPKGAEGSLFEEGEKPRAISPLLDEVQHLSRMKFSFRKIIKKMN